MSRDSAAIVVAGGRGARFGGKIRKQFLSLHGRPLLWWAVHAFDQSPSISLMVAVVPAPAVDWVRQQFARWKMKKPVHVVAGGQTRADSVREGIAALPPGPKYIAVHDGVRPLVTSELIERVLRESRRRRAAIAAIPSKDSVKLARSNGTIERSLPRHTVWLAQTPQAFERKLLEKAHAKGRHLEATDDSMLVERLRVNVKLVEASQDNLKVTVRSDLHLAERLLKGKR